MPRPAISGKAGTVEEGAFLPAEINTIA